MLPLVSNVLPNPIPPASHGSGLNVNLLADAAAAARQQLPVAVASLGAPAAYSPKVPQWRQTLVNERSTSATPSRGEPSLAMPAETGEPPTLPASLVRPQMPAPLLTSQFAAQFIAQRGTLTEREMQLLSVQEEIVLPQLRRDKQMEQRERQMVRDIRMGFGDFELPSAPKSQSSAVPVQQQTQPLPELRRSHGKKPGIGQAYGAKAYGVAEARNASLPFAQSLDRLL